MSDIGVAIFLLIGGILIGIGIGGTLEATANENAARDQYPCAVTCGGWDEAKMVGDDCYCKEVKE